MGSETVPVEQVADRNAPLDFSGEDQTNFVPSQQVFQGMRSGLEQSAWYLKQKPEIKTFSG